MLNGRNFRHWCMLTKKPLGRKKGFYHLSTHTMKAYILIVQIAEKWGHFKVHKLHYKKHNNIIGIKVLLVKNLQV